MKKMRQRDFFETGSDYAPNRISHGGTAAAGRRKLKRPLAPRRPLHLVLKSSAAKGRLSLLSPANDLFIERTLRDEAARYGVVVQRYENMGNHLHAIVKFKSREAFQNFLRTVTALIARFVTGARRGRPFGRRFWDALAFTRVVTGVRDLKMLSEYFDRNFVEREYGRDARVTIEIDEQERRKSRRRKKRRPDDPVQSYQDYLRK